MKIISICPSNTELCVYLGADDLLIALDDYSDWPEHLQSLPKLGPDLSIRMDRLEALNPDLVLASLSVPGMEKNIMELEKRNIPHIIFNPQSLDDIANDLIVLGEALGMKEEAEKRAGQFLASLEEFRMASSRIKHKPSLYWEWWPNPLFTPGGINWLTEISRLAGAYNIFENIELASVQVTPDDVIQHDPDYICLAWVGVPEKKVKPDLVKKRQGWGELQAVKNNNIFILEEPLYCRPSPRLLEGLHKLAGLLHPKEFPLLTSSKSALQE
ncbi:cobalamin-binding protein [Peribacillus sp. B-H-3]|uniref:cobalamin-binding protein n=1 Tax=Peribacillus sp. B-H-3 TaxID=3400420 RepID=UPI003B0134E6